MKNKNKKNIQVALLGFGLDNQSLLKLLLKIPEIEEITICDKREGDFISKKVKPNKKIKYQLGKNFNKDLFKFDVLFRSPGWPVFCPGIINAKKRGSYISSALDVFFQLCPTKNIIVVTGTKGKGTTATLIYKIIDKWKKDKNNKAWLGGNIGISPISFLDKIKKDDFVVLELSSFQLEDLKVPARISVFTNIFKEHLSPADPNNPNYHKSFNKYFEAKLNIVKHSEKSILVANKNLRGKILSKNLKNKIIYFEKSKLQSKIQGEYNKENIAAAVEVAKILKIKENLYQEVIKKFNNLENRLELVSKKNEVKFFNNSFSTTPESTNLDLLSFNNPIIQIAGGADKGASFKSLAKTIKKKVKFLILFPGAGSKKIEKELKALKFPKEKIVLLNSMELAVKKAWEVAKKDDIILLSTACASFGLFKNYKERGFLFKEEVKKIKVEKNGKQKK